MTDSADGESLSSHDGTTRGRPPRPSFTPSSSPAPIQRPGRAPGGEDPAAHPATEALWPDVADEAGWQHTATARGGPLSGSAPAFPGQADSPNSRDFRPQGPDLAEERYGPGVPGSAPADGQGAVSAEEVWRNGRLPGPPPRRGRWWRRGGTALTAALLIACGVLVYLRLHHEPLTVTGVTITSQVKNGCGVDITGRIGTSGGAGTVSYQWVFTPQVTAPHPLSQSVTAGQPAVYVTVSDQGTGHGQLTQQVTLQVLGPGQGRASAHVVFSC